MAKGSIASKPTYTPRSTTEIIDTALVCAIAEGAEVEMTEILSVWFRKDIEGLLNRAVRIEERGICPQEEVQDILPEITDTHLSHLPANGYDFEKTINYIIRQTNAQVWQVIQALQEKFPLHHIQTERENLQTKDSSFSLSQQEESVSPTPVNRTLLKPKKAIVEALLKLQEEGAITFFQKKDLMNPVTVDEMNARYAGEVLCKNLMAFMKEEKLTPQDIRLLHIGKISENEKRVFDVLGIPEEQREELSDDSLDTHAWQERLDRDLEVRPNFILVNAEIMKVLESGLFSALSHICSPASRIIFHAHMSNKDKIYQIVQTGLSSSEKSQKEDTATQQNIDAHTAQRYLTVFRESIRNFITKETQGMIVENRVVQNDIFLSDIPIFVPVMERIIAGYYTHRESSQFWSTEMVSAQRGYETHSPEILAHSLIERLVTKVYIMGKSFRKELQKLVDNKDISSDKAMSRLLKVQGKDFHKKVQMITEKIIEMLFRTVSGSPHITISKSYHYGQKILGDTLVQVCAIRQERDPDMSFFCDALAQYIDSKGDIGQLSTQQRAELIRLFEQMYVSDTQEDIPLNNGVLLETVDLHGVMEHCCD